MSWNFTSVFQTPGKLPDDRKDAQQNDVEKAMLNFCFGFLDDAGEFPSQAKGKAFKLSISTHLTKIITPPAILCCKRFFISSQNVEVGLVPYCP